MDFKPSQVNDPASHPLAPSFHRLKYSHLLIQQAQNNLPLHWTPLHYGSKNTDDILICYNFLFYSVKSFYFNKILDQSPPQNTGCEYTFSLVQHQPNYTLPHSITSCLSLKAIYKYTHHTIYTAGALMTPHFIPYQLTHGVPGTRIKYSCHSSFPLEQTVCTGVAALLQCVRCGYSKQMGESSPVSLITPPL